MTLLELLGPSAGCDSWVGEVRENRSGSLNLPFQFHPAVNDAGTKLDAVARDEDEGLALGEEEDMLVPSVAVREIGYTSRSRRCS